jgi:hypothetical protein
MKILSAALHFCLFFAFYENCSYHSAPQCGRSGSSRRLADEALQDEHFQSVLLTGTVPEGEEDMSWFAAENGVESALYSRNEPRGFRKRYCFALENLSGIQT